MMAGDVEDSYALSPMQRAMLSHSISAPASGAYIQHAICDLHERVDAPRLERAWRRVIERHAALRTAFRVEGIGEPVQIVHRDSTVPWTQDDWSRLAAGERERRFSLYVDADRLRDFDPKIAPLMRLALFRLADDHSRLLWTYHHALLDGRAVRVALREVFDLYDAYAHGRDLQLPPPHPFREHVEWLARQDAAAARRYWRRTLAGHPGSTLPAGHVPPSAGDGRPERYAAHEIRLTAGLSAALQVLARERRLTLNTLVTGAWAQLLGRYTGENDVSFGTTLTLRGADPTAFAEMVGLLINTVPLRVTLPPEMPLSKWLEGLREQWLAMRPHAWAPLPKIRQWAGIGSEDALFSTLVVFENAPLDAAVEEDRKGWTTRRFGRRSAAAHPLTLVAFGGAEVSLKIVYRQSMFDRDAVASMLDHLRTLLEGAVADLERPLAQQKLLTEAERGKILVDWNDTDRNFPAEDCVHRLFERRVARAPDAVAVESAGRSLTYGELNEQSNRLAHHLRRSGVVTGTLVGLCMNRTPEVVVAMLGIMKAGGAYLPLDAANPPERILHVAADAGLATMVTTGSAAAWRNDFAGRLIRLDGDRDRIAAESPKDGAGVAGLDDLAYAVYTSGSTGEPKGILVGHRALANHTLALLERYAIGPADRRLQFVSIGSDVLIAEVFPILLAGGTLVLLPDAGVPSIADFLRFLEDRRITIAGMPSAYWHEWAAAAGDGFLPLPSSLRIVVSGMDRARPDLFAIWKRNIGPRVRWFNAYGPSETTCTAASYEADLSSDETLSTVPIGRPLPNVRIYILDALARPVPVGVPGEICIGGRGVARGYLNRPVLTAEKFVPDPFADDPSSRLYRTGDIGRYRPDGNVEFVGRLDDQIKIRGHRVEPGEVEAALRRLPGVRDACVVARGETGEALRLIAYIVAAAETPPAPSAVRDIARRSLPEYMVPAVIVPLAAIPRAISGKVDYRALPEVGAEAERAERPHAPAGNALEFALMAIWEAVLGTRVGVADSFLDLGGDSLSGVRLASAVRLAFDVEIPIAALFDDAATVAGMASRIGAERARAV